MTQMLSRAYDNVLRQASIIQVKSTTQNLGHRSLASWLLDMSVQNLCFDCLCNKKNNMKYFKNLIIVQIYVGYKYTIICLHVDIQY